jgi:hypothetical protein
MPKVSRGKLPGLHDKYTNPNWGDGFGYTTVNGNFGWGIEYLPDSKHKIFTLYGNIFEECA